jgi:hypothetical protein
LLYHPQDRNEDFSPTRFSAKSIHGVYGCITAWYTRVTSIKRVVRVSGSRHKLRAFNVLGRLIFLFLIYLARSCAFLQNRGYVVEIACLAMRGDCALDHTESAQQT